MMAKKALPPPIFRHDPADMAGLGKQIGGWEDYGKLPEFGLQKVVVASDVILHLSAVLEGLSPRVPGDVVLVLDGTPMWRGGENLKPMVRRLLERE